MHYNACGNTGQEQAGMEQRANNSGMTSFEIAQQEGAEWHRGKPTIIGQAYEEWLKAELDYVRIARVFTTAKLHTEMKQAKDEANRAMKKWAGLNRAWRERGEISTE